MDKFKHQLNANFFASSTLSPIRKRITTDFIISWGIKKEDSTVEATNLEHIVEIFSKGKGEKPLFKVSLDGCSLLNGVVTMALVPMNVETFQPQSSDSCIILKLVIGSENKVNVAKFANVFKELHSLKGMSITFPFLKILNGRKNRYSNGV